MLSTKAATTNKRVMPHSAAATRLGVHQDRHDDRRKNGNASKTGSSGTGSMTGSDSSGLTVIDSDGVDCSIAGATTIGRSRNSSVPVDGRADRGDRGEEGLSGTVRKILRSLASFLFCKDSASDAALSGFCP